MKLPSPLRGWPTLLVCLAGSGIPAAWAQAPSLAAAAAAAPVAAPATAVGGESSPEEASTPIPDFEPPRSADAPAGPGWNEAQVSDEFGFGWVLLRTLVVLGVVLASIYLTLNYGLRRLMGIKGVPGGRASVVTLLERVPLDQKRSLFVIKAAGEYLLVGGAEGALTLLSKLDPAEVERLQREKSAAPLVLSPFLQKLLTRRGGPPPPTA